MKTAHFVFAGVLAAALLLGGCTTDTPEPSSTAPIETLAPTEATSPALQSPESPESLDDLFLVNNDTVVYNGQVIARGNATLVRNLATNEPVGYTLLTLYPKPDLPEDAFPNDVCVRQFTLYHKDGSFWQDCGTLGVSGVLGDWFYGLDFGTYETFACKQLTGEEDRIPVDMANLSPDRCLIWNAEKDFLGFTGIAVVDENMTILNQLEATQKAEYGPYYTPANYLVLENFGVVDARTMELLPYKSVSEINDGCHVFQTADGLYDLKDEDGNPVITGSKNNITFYNDHVRIEIHTEEEPYIWEDLVYLNGALAYSGEDVHAGYWNGGIYVQLENPDQVFLYDFNGQPLAQYAPKDSENTAYAYNSGGLLNVWDGEKYHYWFTDVPYDLPFSDEDAMLSQVWGEDLNASRFALGHRLTTNGGGFVYDLLDEEGNLLQSGFSDLRSTQYPDIYWAQRGFSCGLIDQGGNWLWKESIFAANDNS